LGIRNQVLGTLLIELKKMAKDYRCSFVRMSPFWPVHSTEEGGWPPAGTRPSPLHLLAEHVWYLPLVTPDPWTTNERGGDTPRLEEEILMDMRKTTRNLVRRAERDGVEVIASPNPTQDISTFLALHEETRRRHHFTPYTAAFFRAQVERFAPRGECTLYLARYQGKIIASSIHMHIGGETSYHHGASSQEFSKIPASTLLQWTAIRDAMQRGNHIYNFWGIAPEGAPRHPFAGVTLFKTGFGGRLLPLVHCVDFPLKWTYTCTRIFEQIRRLQRGF
jgi:lipid II:glycine glycyltransferase (peptidoglycan interpeptide bridge formation enzyme)